MARPGVKLTAPAPRVSARPPHARSPQGRPGACTLTPNRAVGEAALRVGLKATQFGQVEVSVASDHAKRHRTVRACASPRPQCVAAAKPRPCEPPFHQTVTIGQSAVDADRSTGGHSPEATSRANQIGDVRGIAARLYRKEEIGNAASTPDQAAVSAQSRALRDEPSTASTARHRDTY
jgi:hypothetical protein